MYIQKITIRFFKLERRNNCNIYLYSYRCAIRNLDYLMLTLLSLTPGPQVTEQRPHGCAIHSVFPATSSSGSLAPLCSGGSLAPPYCSGSLAADSKARLERRSVDSLDCSRCWLMLAYPKGT